MDLMQAFTAKYVKAEPPVANVPSSTSCATAWARVPSSRRSCKNHTEKERETAPFLSPWAVNGLFKREKVVYNILNTPIQRAGPNQSVDKGAWGK